MKRPTLPDWFSLYRLAAAPAIILTLARKKETPFLALSAISLATDAADGFLARRLKQETPRGARLDSLGDFITQLLMAAGLARFKKPFLKEHKASLLAIAGAYGAQLLTSLAKYKKPTSFHTYSSKLAFTVTGLFYLGLFLNKEARQLYYLSVALLLVSLTEDLLLTITLPAPKDNAKGLYWVLKEKE